jgi:hypothetical protein
MASATMTVNVRLRRVWLFTAWLWLAARLVRFGFRTAWTVRIANALLGVAYIECRDERGRRLGEIQYLPMRLEIE